MIGALCRVFLCLGLGEVLARFSPWPVPGAVLGFLILFVDLCRLRYVPEQLGVVADRLLQALGLFFVPAGVGALTYRDAIQSDAITIVLVLTIGTIVTITVTALAAALVSMIFEKRKTLPTWTPTLRQDS